ncbi:MAG TPA: tripartite tricarboxylate transporter substrate binding protein [Rhodospirillales bacterium]
MKSSIHRILTAVLAAIMVTGAGAVRAEYPEKPVQIVVPYGPGGSTDLALRALSSVIHEYLGQPVVVLNKTGGGGAVGVVYGLKQKPDGYVLMGGAIGAHVLTPAANKAAGYGPGDFTPIAMTQLNPNVFVVKADSPYKSIKDVIEAIKANPGKFKQSNPGPGSIHNFGFNLLMDAAGIPSKSVISVPFKGGAASAAALLGGHVDFHQTNLTNVIELIKGGKLRALAVTSPQRLKLLPDVPTYAELGYPGVDIYGWRGVIGPKGLPQEIVDKWAAAIKKTQGSKAWTGLVTKLGDEPTYMGPKEFKDHIDKGFVKYRKMAKDLGILVE